MDSPCDDNGQEVWTSQMIVAPAFVDAAAKDLATIGSAISRANAEALVPITALLPAGADDVSAAIAALFATHGQAYQELSAHAVAFHEQFVQLMSAGAAQYASAEAANSSPLQIVGQTALDAINSPAAAANIGADPAPANTLAELTSGGSTAKFGSIATVLPQPRRHTFIRCANKQPRSRMKVRTDPERGGQTPLCIGATITVPPTGAGAP